MPKSLIALMFSALAVFAIPAIAQTPTPTPLPRVSPTPSATPKPTPATQTIETLRSRLRQTLLRPEAVRGSVGVKIISAATGKVVFEENAEKYFMPASNMKNFTVATALEMLGPDHKIVTSLYAQAQPSGGALVGGLRVFGRGDVSISDRFHGGDPLKTLDSLADKIAALGITRIEGDIVADDSYFRGFPIPQGWEWDDLQWSYGAEVSSLPINDSVVELRVTPGPSGYTCTVKITPYNPVIRVANACITTAAGTRRTLRIHKRLDQNMLEISGGLPLGNAGFSGDVSVSRPAELFAALLRQKLIDKGITVTGGYRNERRNDASLPTGVEIGTFESVPLSVIAAHTMKPSQNMYTETLLWTLGENARLKNQVPANAVSGVAEKDSAELGVAEVKGFLTSIGIAPDAVLQYDGSGLSRHNLVTPSAVVRLYEYMGKQSRASQAWRDSLTIASVDGTLRNRFRGTRASGNVRGKTGTIDQVSALSGYLKTAGGEDLIFSVIVNGVAEPAARVALIDQMIIDVANFDGRID